MRDGNIVKGVVIVDPDVSVEYQHFSQDWGLGLFQWQDIDPGLFGCFGTKKVPQHGLRLAVALRADRSPDQEFWCPTKQSSLYILLDRP